MNIYLMVYLIGMGIKTFSFMINHDEESASDMFNEIVLWPWYLLMDIFFGIMSIF